MRTEPEKQRRHPGQGESLESSLLKKVEIQEKEIIRLKQSLEDIREGYEGACCACELVGSLNREYRQASKELLEMLEIEKTSPRRSTLKPSKPSTSCLIAGMRMNQALKTLKALSA